MQDYPCISGDAGGERLMGVNGFMSSGVLRVIVGGALLLVGGTMAGCSWFGVDVLPPQLESHLVHGTAEDHFVASLLYQKQAHRLELEAERYEHEAAMISPHEDTKGFRRSGFTVAAQRCRKEAADMQQLATEHRRQADALMEKEKAEGK